MYHPVAVQADGRDEVVASSGKIWSQLLAIELELELLKSQPSYKAFLARCRPSSVCPARLSTESHSRVRHACTCNLTQVFLKLKISSRTSTFKESRRPKRGRILPGRTHRQLYFRHPDPAERLAVTTSNCSEGRVDAHREWAVILDARGCVALGQANESGHHSALG